MIPMIQDVPGQTLRAFEEEERDLVREARRFVLAVVLSVAAIPIIADPAVGWIGFLPALVCLSLGGFVFLVLRSSGLWAAIGASVGLTIMALSLLYLNLQGYVRNRHQPPTSRAHVF
jgi:hypothetical protein